MNQVPHSLPSGLWKYPVSVPRGTPEVASVISVVHRSVGRWLHYSTCDRRMQGRNLEFQWRIPSGKIFGNPSLTFPLPSGCKVGARGRLLQDAPRVLALIVTMSLRSVIPSDPLRGHAATSGYRRSQRCNETGKRWGRLRGNFHLPPLYYLINTYIPPISIL